MQKIPLSRRVLEASVASHFGRNVNHKEPGRQARVSAIGFRPTFDRTRIYLCTAEKKVRGEFEVLGVWGTLISICMCRRA